MQVPFSSLSVVFTMFTNKGLLSLFFHPCFSQKSSQPRPLFWAAQLHTLFLLCFDHTLCFACTAPVFVLCFVLFQLCFTSCSALFLPCSQDIIVPLPEALATGQKPIYKQVLYSDCVRHFFKKAHSGKKTVDVAKI